MIHSRRSARRRRVGRPRVAGDAKRRSVARLVAAEAAPHRRHARDLGHGVKLTDIAVARCALRPGLQMLAMRPSNAGSDLVHPHPGNGLPGFGKLRELHDCGLIFGNGGVAGHASPRCRKRHQISGIGIGVAHLALQSQRQVRLVAVGNRLLGRGMRPKIVEHLLPGRRRSLLGLHHPSREKQRNAYPRAPNYSAVFHQAPRLGPDLCRRATRASSTASPRNIARELYFRSRAIPGAGSTWSPRRTKYSSSRPCPLLRCSCPNLSAGPPRRCAPAAR